MAGRYLRARRGERFVSIIAIFSLVGIALGVATLIIVMSVMGGFKVDLLNRILGFNGDLGLYGARHADHDYPTLDARIAAVRGGNGGDPGGDGQVLATPQRLEDGTAAFVRGITQTGCDR